MLPVLSFVLVKGGSAVPKRKEALELNKVSLEPKEESYHLEVSNDFLIVLFVLQGFQEDIHTGNLPSGRLNGLEVAPASCFNCGEGQPSNL